MTPPLPRRGSVAAGVTTAVIAVATSLATPSSAAPTGSLVGTSTRLAPAAAPTSPDHATGPVSVVEPRLPARPDVEAAPAPATAPTVDADPFTLHSRPGSRRTIYLDFTGQVLRHTVWNDTEGRPKAVTVAPFDVDGDPSTTGPDERAVITSVWQRVAEDFAATEVDVTTQEPASGRITRTTSADQTYGTRVLFSPDDLVYSSCGCAGAAYVGAFDETPGHDYHQPALVFLRGVGTGAKGMAEAASHEVGHTLGLSHDGTSGLGYFTGQGLWAPIMGASYDRPLTQWSRGEYADANNPEDDFAVMAAHGAAPVKDDVPDSRSRAAAFTGPPTTGTISSSTDLDVFRVDHAGGTLTVTASPAAVSPDLDLRLTLTTARGVVVATAAPPSWAVDADVAAGLDASLSVPLAAGAYYVTVQGSGQDDPHRTGYTGYGSVGRYTLTSP